MTKIINKTSSTVITAAVAAGVALAVLIVGIVIYSNASSANKYDIQDYLYEIEFSGTNGNGVVLAPSINYRAMDSLGLERAYNLSDVMDTVTYTADPYEGLSNGDTVTIKATYDETMGKNRGVKLTNLKWKVKVQGLSE